MKDPDYLARLDRDLELLDRIRSALPSAFIAARQDGAGIKAASYGVRGSGSVLWCWTHQTEVHRCHRADRDCSGESVSVGDPTGEAAIAPGRVDIANAQIRSALDKLHSLCEPLLFDVAWLTRSPETHSEARRREDERRDLAGSNEPRCRSCERTEVAPGLRRAEPVYRRTDGGGVYPEPTPLCSWCYRFVFDTERAPTVDELDRHHRGEKVRRKA